MISSVLSVIYRQIKILPKFEHDQSNNIDNPKVECAEDEFSCADQCHSLDRKCDGVQDCQDGTDEIGCDDDDDDEDNTERDVYATTQAPIVRWFWDQNEF